jgi:hypothetical protein
MSDLSIENIKDIRNIIAVACIATYEVLNGTAIKPEALQYVYLIEHKVLSVGCTFFYKARDNNKPEFVVNEKFVEKM